MPALFDLRRHKAVTADASTTTTTVLSEVWALLGKGKLKVVDEFTDDARNFLLLKPPDQRRAPVPSFARKLRGLETALTEGGLKVAAFELACKPPTVVLHARSVFAFMGLSCLFGRTPPLLVMAACAARGMPVLTARACELFEAGGRVTVVSVPRLDLLATPLLSPGERDVVRLLFEGKSHAEIARARQRSPRTVANQLGSVFRKLHVSGRLELIHRLAALRSRELDLPSRRPALSSGRHRPAAHSTARASARGSGSE